MASGYRRVDESCVVIAVKALAAIVKSDGLLSLTRQSLQCRKALPALESPSRALY